MSEQPIPQGEVTSDDKLWGLLAYLLTPIVPIIILLMEEKKNRPFLKAHTMQSLLLGLVCWVVNFVLSFIMIGCVTSILTVILVIYYGLKAYKGETFEIPVITNFAKNQGWM